MTIKLSREEMRNSRIGVLMGGVSAEREVSLRTGQAALGALRAAGCEAVAVDAGPDLPARLVETGVEVAFIALHGRHGEDGTVQGLLEIMGIPYTGSGVLASSLAMDKRMTKELLIRHGVSTPAFVSYRHGDDLDVLLHGWQNYPVVVKPAREGSTIGISRVEDRAGLDAGLRTALQHDELALVEEFIDGVELTVAVLDGAALPIIQVVPKDGFYDYQAKYTPGQTEYLLPAPLAAGLTRRVQDAAVAACALLGCRGAARVDFMVRGDELFCLEVNTIPGMTETSLLPKAAAAAGIDFRDLVLRILDDAGLDK
ncbi:MAG: D-alanine--D-alanine ligase [Desulfuromonadales bacterium]|nr:D-alanine--D-alanine ligase [Desulfuromonadales bacterium]